MARMRLRETCLLLRNSVNRKMATIKVGFPETYSVIFVTQLQYGLYLTLIHIPKGGGGLASKYAWKCVSERKGHRSFLGELRDYE